jgi:hypothetical protein
LHNEVAQQGVAGEVTAQDSAEADAGAGGTAGLGEELFGNEAGLGICSFDPGDPIGQCRTDRFAQASHVFGIGDFVRV